MTIYSFVDKNNLFAGTVDTGTIDEWIKANTRKFLDRTIHIPSPQEYAISLGHKCIKVISPPTPTPVVGCWKWCGIKNTWKLNDDANTFPTELVLKLRQKAYKRETDGLKLDAEFDAIVNNTSPDYTAWIAAKLLIRSNYPLLGSTDG